MTLPRQTYGRVDTSDKHDADRARLSDQRRRVIDRATDSMSPGKGETLRSGSKRPYMSLWVTELEKRVDEGWLDAKFLASVYRELEHRSRRRASSLRDRVEQRLHELQEGPFHWPTTQAPQSSMQVPQDVFGRQQGVLSGIGYRVGTHGLDRGSRRKLLDQVYRRAIPDEIEPVYASEWGAPVSARRLRKLANTIAALTRNAKRRSHDMECSITDWETDLAYLKRVHYDGTYDFRWPSTTAS